MRNCEISHFLLKINFYPNNRIRRGNLVFRHFILFLSFGRQIQKKTLKIGSILLIECLLLSFLCLCYKGIRVKDAKKILTVFQSNRTYSHRVHYSTIWWRKKYFVWFDIIFKDCFGGRASGSKRNSNGSGKYIYIFSFYCTLVWRQKAAFSSATQHNTSQQHFHSRTLETECFSTKFSLPTQLGSICRTQRDAIKKYFSRSPLRNRYHLLSVSLYWIGSSIKASGGELLLFIVGHQHLSYVSFGRNPRRDLG